MHKQRKKIPNHSQFNQAEVQGHFASGIQPHPTPNSEAAAGWTLAYIFQCQQEWNLCPTF